RATDTQQDGHDPAHAVVARFQEARDEAYDKADDDGSDNAHWQLSSSPKISLVTYSRTRSRLCSSQQSSETDGRSRQSRMISDSTAVICRSSVERSGQRSVAWPTLRPGLNALP